MKTFKKTQPSGNQTLAMGLLALSFAFAATFIISICIVGQRLRVDNTLGAPNSYAVLASTLLAAYVWAYCPRPVHRYRYAIVVIMTMIVTGLVIWLYGMTGAGNTLIQARV